MEGNLPGKFDGALGSSAAATGLLVWLDYLELYGGAAMTIGGVALLGIRIALGIREWRKGKEK